MRCIGIMRRRGGSSSRNGSLRGPSGPGPRAAQRFLSAFAAGVLGAAGFAAGGGDAAVAAGAANESPRDERSSKTSLARPLPAARAPRLGAALVLAGAAAEAGVLSLS